jgi:mono/diheme cytochrome c family protein|tara:strand:- start:1517 stop:2287 length:771 start_codon:yes stop_codon:yes gene_type:complete
VTEVPEYLFERSRQRRIDLGLLEDDGSGGGGGGASAGEALTSSGSGSAEVIAAAKADAKLEQLAEPEAEPGWVSAARNRTKIPMWALPVMFFLPLWAFVYVKLTEPPPEPVTAITEGAAIYAARCASCHGGDGAGSDGGGVGRPLYNGEVLLTFPKLEADMLHWLEVGSEGIGLGNAYGATDRTGGSRISGETGANMPGFGGTLSEYKIYSVARYIREVLSQEPITDEEIAARDAEWEDRGGGKDVSGGGHGHGGH